MGIGVACGSGVVGYTCVITFSHYVCDFISIVKRRSLGKRRPRRLFLQ